MIWLSNIPTYSRSNEDILNTDTFIIRVDASESIGLGHLVRCLLIANFIKDKGCDVVFVTEQSLSQNIIESKGFKCHRISGAIPNLMKLYSPFSVIADINSDTIFNNKVDYFNHLRDLGRKAKLLVTLEDLINYPYCSDVVIIPYCGAGKLKLKNDCNARYLIGPDYFPLRKEFKNDSFVVSRIAKKILITMGGSDPEKITLKVLSSINELDKFYDIVVVLGKASNILDKDIDNAMDKYKGLLTVLSDVENMSKLMLDCDIAITNSGLTKYELSALGIPSIIISNSKQQATYSEDFSSYGSSIHLGEVDIVSEKSIQVHCVDLMLNYNSRFNMSEKGKSLIDNNGLDRIYKVISNST